MNDKSNKELAERDQSYLPSSHIFTLKQKQNIVREYLTANLQQPIDQPVLNTNQSAAEHSRRFDWPSAVCLDVMPADCGKAFQAVMTPVLPAEPNPSNTVHRETTTSQFGPIAWYTAVQ